MFKYHPAAAGAASSPTNQRNRSKHCSSITLEEQNVGSEDDDNVDGNLTEKSPNQNTQNNLQFFCLAECYTQTLCKPFQILLPIILTQIWLFSNTNTLYSVYSYTNCDILRRSSQKFVQSFVKVETHTHTLLWWQTHTIHALFTKWFT